jgi:hypothetical protein
MPVIPALGRLEMGGFCVGGQPDLFSEPVTQKTKMMAKREIKNLFCLCFIKT